MASSVRILRGGNTGFTDSVSQKWGGGGEKGTFDFYVAHDNLVQAVIYVREGASARLNCDFTMASSTDGQESLYSVIWYFEDDARIPIFRYRAIDSEGQRKKAWLKQVGGRFDIDVSTKFIPDLRHIQLLNS